MGNIITAAVTIRGTRPFWQHAFGPDAMPLEKQERTGVAGNDPEEWRKTCAITPDGQLYFDGTYVFGCLKAGAKYTKSGKGSIATKLTATVQVLDDKVMLDRFYPGFPNGHIFDAKKADACMRDDQQPVYLDVRGVVNPSTRGRNVRYRVAAAPGWQATFRILWDKTVVSRNEMESVLIDAGRLVGIGSGRAIGMGRFEIVSIELAE